MQSKTVRSGAPYLFAGVAVFIVALGPGIGTLPGYLLAAAAGFCAFVVSKRMFPDRTITVEVAPHSGDAQVDALIAEAREQLRLIRKANDVIAERALSEQIDDIDNTCGKLLARLEEQPGMLSSLRTFLRYYLPTTLKLLNARAALEEEVAAGGGAQMAERIREAMAQVQTALHRQLDALNEYRFLDLESEMDALAEMLKSDGLTGDDVPEPKAPDAPQQEDPFGTLFGRGAK